MEKKETNLNEDKIKENIEDNKKISNPIINEKENKNILDLNSSDSQILTELAKLEKKNNNDLQNNNISKSLSEINKNNSDEDKKNISIKSIIDSNIIFNTPKSKRIIVEINKLSQRVRKDENENESNNRIISKELRSKYFPHKSNNNFQNNYNIFRENKNLPKTFNNVKLKSVNTDINNKIEMNKKILMPIIDLENDNKKKDNLKNNINKENNNLDLPKKNNFFINLLKEDNNFIDKIKPITKEELLSFSNEKEKIIALLEKNKQLMNILRTMDEKYKILKHEYIELYKNSNSIGNYNNNNENDEYKKYLLDENKNYKRKLENYDKIFHPLLNYINDLNNELNLKQINSFELKKSINLFDSFNISGDKDKNNPLNKFLKVLNENKDFISERKNTEIDDIKYRNKILNKIRSHSNYEDRKEISKKILLTERKGNKNKMKNYYDKI